MMVVCNQCKKITLEEAEAQNCNAHSASVCVENYKSTETTMMEKEFDNFLERSRII